MKKVSLAILKQLFLLVGLWGGIVHGQITQSFKSNSFIVNMGVTPQTISNGLKPYGMVYDLVKNYNVPISWVINPNKAIDGIDFSFQGTQFKGSAFIIPAEFRTTEVNARINYWQTQGVIGVNTSSPLTLDIIYHIITSVPRWVLDLANGSIALAYLNNAMIPNTAFQYKNTNALNCCDDLYSFPHADPTWATHSNLYFWNQSCKGGIWAACHAVSALENSIDPSNSSQQMNFLSKRDNSKVTPTPYPSNSLTLWVNHANGTPAYITRLPSDPVQQYIGAIDAATQNGAEQIYLPIQSGSSIWNPGAKILVYDPTQTNVSDPKSDLSKAAVVAIYGRGFDDPNRGYIMYEAGHSHAKSTAPANVAAQRAFINFSFLNQFERIPIFNGFTTPSAIMNVAGGPYLFSVDAVAAFGGSLHYDWKSSCGGTFSAPNSSITNFSPPVVNSEQACIISVTVTDECGRANTHSWGVTINQGPQPPIALNDTIHIPTGCGAIDPVTINIGANDSDPDGDPLSFSLVGTGTGGTWVNIGEGILRYTPSDNFSGTARQQYRVCDNTTNPGALCDTAYAVVLVGTLDEHGCLSNQVFGFAGNYQQATTQSTFAGTITNGANILGESDDLFAQIGNNNAATIQVDMGSIAPTGRTFSMIWKSNNTNMSTVTIAYSIDGITFTNLSGSISTVVVHNEFQESEFVLPAAARYLRIARSAGTPQIDAIGFEEYSCVSRVPQVANYTVNMLEDLPVQVNVLGNAVDPIGEVLLLRRIVANPKRGIASVNLNGTITYVNNTDISGRDTLTYEVCNTSGYCSIATVYFNIVDDGCASGQYKPYTAGGVITKVFQYGFTGTNAATANDTNTKFKDTQIKQDDANKNFGGAKKVEIGKTSNKEERLLNYFDISEIPTSAIINSATFSLYGKGGDNDNIIFTIENLTVPFTESQVTWNNRQTGPNVAWTVAGAGSNVGSVWASATVGKIKNLWYSWDITNLVENWVVTPASNYGMLIRQNGLVNKKKQFATKEGRLAERPILTVTYVVPAPCTTIPNRSPLAQPDFATVKSTDSVWVKPLANDKDPDIGNTISLNSVIGVTHGTATIRGDSLKFVPTFGFNGNATVQYVLIDNYGAKDTALINITCTNAAPIAKNDTVVNLSGNTFVINVKSNDLDPEGDTLSAPAILVQPKNGEAKVVGTAIQYIPNVGYTGVDTIKYSVCETAFEPGDCNPVFLCASAFVFITVDNRPPVATNDTTVAYPCFESIFNILENDFNPELTNVTATIILGPHNGIAYIGGDNKLYYKANNGFLGNDSIVYKITDSDKPPLSATAKVFINVQLPIKNEPPIARDDYEETQVNEILYASVLDNDEDPEGDPLTVSLSPELLQPSKGTATVMPNGLIKYVPFPGAMGMDYLEYKICETAILDINLCTHGVGFCDIARLSIEIIHKPVPLPIELLSFTGYNEGSVNVLSWTTASERNSLKFEIEKSYDANGFEKIGEVVAAGNSYIDLNYTFNDNYPQIGSNYYRLKMIDIDGTFKYSEIINIRVREDNLPITDGIMKIYPNPTKGYLNIQYQSSRENELKLGVFDVVGQQMLNKTEKLNKGMNIIQINATQFANGIYILNLIDDEHQERHQTKFIKE